MIMPAGPITCIIDICIYLRHIVLDIAMHITAMTRVHVSLFNCSSYFFHIKEFFPANLRTM